MIELDREQVLAYRLRMNHLTGRRLAHSDLATAAASGLQDSAPRSALLSLAARVDDVRPDDWRAPGIAQVFGPRGAIYVVAGADVPVFTLGLLPRDPERLARLEAVAAQALDVLGGQAMRQRDLDAALPDVGSNRELRWAACLGTLLPVWDAVDTIIHPKTRPSMDTETARGELAKRFFRHLGPATVADFQWWTAGDHEDAATTVAALGDQLTAVLVAGTKLLALSETLDDLVGSGPIDRDLVLLLPPDDTYIYRRARFTLLNGDSEARLLWPKAPPPGALIVGGFPVGTWRRRGGNITVRTWQPVAEGIKTRVAEIARGWPLAATDIRVSWGTHD